AVRVGVVLLIVGHALRAQLARPVLKRWAAFDVRTDVEEGGARRRVRIARRASRLDAELVAAAVRLVLQRARRARLTGRRRRRDRAQVDLPEAGQIGLAVGRFRRWRAAGQRA